MPLLAWIIVFTVLGGVLSVLMASIFLLLPQGFRTRLLPTLVSFAIGALLGAAFLALLPDAIVEVGTEQIHFMGIVVLLGLLAFFLLEKMIIWRHCHSHDCEVHGSTSVAGDTTVHSHNIEQAQTLAAGNLILIGDGIHNLLDGVLIAAAFLTDIHLGIVTSVAVIAHEIPQEVGDFAILLQSGFSRAKALLYNVLTSLTTVIGGVVAYFALPIVESMVPYVLAVAASSFIYIAVADLIPGLHKRPEFSATAQQVALIILGVMVIYVTHSTLH
ncbi:MAG: ZIP family metal transporter [Gammaproteobacteria bacterium]|nr:MAG: ZIP family metal transporter [Gammaproteobacteria bacterium]